VSDPLDFDGLIVDLDGVVWLGGRPLPGSVAALAELRARGLRLASVIHDAAWPAAAPLVARCDLHAHDAPDERCTCGIHAARSPDDVTTYLRGRDDPRTVARVVGRVRVWGRVVEHERGWRASHALPLELVVGDDALRRRLPMYA
jgi:hypothetical protein